MPLHAWLIRGHRVRQIFLDLKKSEFYPREALEALQLQRLQAIVAHHYQTSTYFRRRLDEANVHPSEIDDLTQLSRLPFLTKNDLRENSPTELTSSAVSPKHMIRISTSGSTGTPLSIFADREQLEARFATTLHALEWTGWRFGDRQVRLWHQSLGMSLSQVVRERLDALLLRRKFIPAFEMTPESIEKFLTAVSRHHPVLIDGYAESLNFLASFVSFQGTWNINPAAVMSSAQALPRQTRAAIERAFGAQVFDKYGSREFSGIAYECQSHTGHHVMEESYIVELLVDGRPAQPGEIGEVVVTDLLNHATPMIRYRIGDLAEAMSQIPSCGCGRAHLRIGEIAGRSQAIVHCANGVWLPGTFFAHFFKDYEATVKFFQIEQSDKGKFVLKIVEGINCSESEISRMIFNLRKYVGDTHIEIRKVTEIPMLKTGKRSPVVSNVAEDFQNVSAVQPFRT
jgi:phenylacetate-CoA ligase